LYRHHAIKCYNSRAPNMEEVEEREEKEKKVNEDCR
jgi:hypothetical protein